MLLIYCYHFQRYVRQQAARTSDTSTPCGCVYLSLTEITERRNIRQRMLWSDKWYGGKLEPACGRAVGLNNPQMLASESACVCVCVHKCRNIVRNISDMPFIHRKSPVKCLGIVQLKVRPLSQREPVWVCYFKVTSLELISKESLQWLV